MPCTNKDTDAGLDDLYRTQTLITLFLTHLSRLCCREQLAAGSLKEGGSLPLGQEQTCWRRAGFPKLRGEFLGCRKICLPNASLSMACGATHNSHHFNYRFGRTRFPVKIDEEMRTSYIDYSMSVIVARALPDVRDGFKPVHRRVLFGMNELGNTSDKPTKKSARIVGEVMGKYHPHGDSSIYGTLVRMAQPWNMRSVLVDGQGNFGSIDGDGAAAMRYTEARLSKLAEEMLRDIEKDTVDMQLNFDDSLKEPVDQLADRC